jgi:flagellar basal-body rod modification protein FlgD
MPNSIPSTPPVSNTPPTTTRNSSVMGPGGALGKDEFLKLLTTQLRYQDPLNPMDGQQMATQLAQFSSVEQLINISEQITAQEGQFATLTSAMNNNVALGTIGKTVVAAGDEIDVVKDANGDYSARVITDLNAEGQATVTVKNAAGKVVATVPLGYVAQSSQREFDIGTSLNTLPPGPYTYEVNVKTPSGDDVPQQTYTLAKIDGVGYGPGGAVLLSGTREISIGHVVKIIN